MKKGISHNKHSRTLSHTHKPNWHTADQKLGHKVRAHTPSVFHWTAGVRIATMSGGTYVYFVCTIWTNETICNCHKLNNSLSDESALNCPCIRFISEVWVLTTVLARCGRSNAAAEFSAERVALICAKQSIDGGVSRSIQQVAERAERAPIWKENTQENRERTYDNCAALQTLFQVGGYQGCNHAKLSLAKGYVPQQILYSNCVYDYFVIESVVEELQIKK